MARSCCQTRFNNRRTTVVDDLLRGLEAAELDVEGSDPVRHDAHAVGDVPDHDLLDGERHLASSRVRSVGSEDVLVRGCGVVASVDVGGVKRVEGPVGPDDKRDQRCVVSEASAWCTLVLVEMRVLHAWIAGLVPAGAVS